MPNYTLHKNVYLERNRSVAQQSTMSQNSLFCFGSRYYLRRLPVAFRGFLQQFFFNIETKFDADSLLLKNPSYQV